jgi:nucleoside-diphosphate-sugar epimerase
VRVPIDPSCLDAALVRAENDLRNLDGARIFLTGGTGFFGRWLLELLARAQDRLGLDIEVTVLTRNIDAFAATQPRHVRSTHLRPVAGDVRDFDFPHGSFSHVIHAATDTSALADRDRMAQIAVIAEGTRRILEFSRKAAVQRLLYVSSGAVYGRQPSSLPRIAEHYEGACDTLDPRSAYGNAKRLAEQMCAVTTANKETACIIARCFAFVGPGLPLDGHFAIGNFIRDALQGQPVVVTGDGTSLRSYLYAGDLAAWLLALLVRGRPGSAYNVGSDDGYSIADVADRVARLISGTGVEIRGIPEPDAPRSRYLPDIGRARRELGLDVWTSLDEAIMRTAEAVRRTW